MIIREINRIKNKINDSNFLVFDFDGVLADSVDIKTKAFAEIYQEYGDDVVHKVVSHHLNNGMSRFRKIKFYHQEFLGKRITHPEIILLAKRFSSLVVNKVINSQEIPGASIFLNIYSKSDKECAINSASPQIEIQKIIQKKGLNDHFSAVLGSPSSKYDNFIKLFNLFNCNSSELIFFGDSYSDYLAAKNVNVPFIAVGKNILDSLEDEKNEIYYIDNFLELIK